jgi:adenosylhomocysteine nucleosidase
LPPDARILVITPMPKEFHFFLQGCTRQGYQAEHATLGRLPVVHLPELGVTLARGGVGKAQFALQTQHLLDASPGWDLVICAGAAGALADELSIGDVVVGTCTVEHDYNNKFNAQPAPCFDGAPGALADLRRVPPPGSFAVRFGPVASGDEDIMDGERRLALRQWTQALACAWEGAGGARACRFSQVPFLEIRGMTDTADHRAPLDFEANLEIAMNNVALLVTSFLIPDSFPQEEE